MTAALTYRASTDPFVFWVSVAVSLLFLVIALVSGRMALVAQSGGFRIGGLVVMLLCVGLLAVAYLYAPRGYRLTDTALTVNRPGPDVEIEMSHVRGVEPYEITLTGAARTFGNGGLFGVYGRFRNQELGPFTIYGSRLGSGVVLRTDGGPVVLTPDDVDGFAQEIRTRISGNG